MDKPRGDRRVDRQGQGLVEFSLVSVLMFIAFFGILELSWAFYNLLYLHNACSKAARLSVRGASNADVQTMLVNEKGGLTIATSNIDFFDPTFNPTTGRLPGNFVRVSATILYPRDTPLNNLVQFVGFSTLRGEVTQRIE